MSVFTNPASGSAEHAKAYTAAIVGLLDARKPLDVLEQTGTVLRGEVRGLTPAQLAAPEAPGKWSIGQMLRHLADSEIVWGFRLRMVLAHDRPTITGYDQDLWATRLRYDEADVEDSLRTFEVLRDGNLKLLRRASPEDLKRVGVHAERGEESIEHMLRLYAGHDLMHLNQLARIRAAIVAA